MKPLSFITVFFTASIISAAKLTRHPSKQASTLTPVPGVSPLVFCDGFTNENDIIRIDYVNITPNPPKPGQDLEISAAGVVKEQILPGAYAHVQVKYGYIKLLDQRLDLCEHAEEVDLSCPIEPGPIKLTKTVSLPRVIPPGTYHALADAKTVDDGAITCLSAQVVFDPLKSLDEL